MSALVLDNGGTEDEAVAGLLHDGLEDAPTQEEADARRDQIRHRFGDGVLAIVEACTDAEPHGKAQERALDDAGRRAAWQARKEQYLEHLRHAPGPVLLVGAADKVHNAGAIVRDVGAHGSAVFDRFVGWVGRQVADVSFLWGWGAQPTLVFVGSLPVRCVRLSADGLCRFRAVARTPVCLKRTGCGSGIRPSRHAVNRAVGEGRESQQKKVWCSDWEHERRFGCIGQNKTLLHRPDMTLDIEIEREEDGRWIAEVPSLSGVLAYGATESEARARAQALALRVLADRLEHGEVSPDLMSISFPAA